MPEDLTAVVERVADIDKPREGKDPLTITKAWFVNHPNDRGPIYSFSLTARPVLHDLAEKKTPAKFSVEQAKEPFQGKYEYEIKKISSEDGKTVLYEPEQKKKNYQQRASNPEWSFRTPEERAEERRSIEAQTALQYATRTMESAMQYSDLDADGAVEFVKLAFGEFVQLIRNAASRGAGSGSQSSGTDGQGRSPSSVSESAGAPAAPPPSGSGSTSQATPSSGAGMSPSPDRPSSESAPVDTSDLDAITGSAGKTKLAFKKHFKLDPTVENMTIERLTELAGVLLAAG